MKSEVTQLKKASKCPCQPKITHSLELKKVSSPPFWKQKLTQNLCPKLQSPTTCHSCVIMKKGVTRSWHKFNKIKSRELLQIFFINHKCAHKGVVVIVGLSTSRSSGDQTPPKTLMLKCFQITRLLWAIHLKKPSQSSAHSNQYKWKLISNPTKLNSWQKGWSRYC